MVNKHISKTDKKKLMDEGKKIVSASGATVILFNEELKKIEKEEKETWKKLSFLL
jgi:hypothetical protein